MLATCQTAKDIDGVPTEVLIQVFADRILVLVTQLGKVGNLVCEAYALTIPALMYV